MTGSEPLGARIADLIAAQGPISVAQYMALALHDAQSGYYATRQPFGAAGDFITAPEISQMFGEMLGLWCVQVWHDQGQTKRKRLVELGPGRGTIMADALRAAHAAPEFLEGLEVVLVEASPALQKIQAEKLKDYGVTIRWTAHFDDSLADQPLFLLANEFFDALPVRQYVKTERGWCERMVVAKDGVLDFALAPTPTPSAIIAASRAGAPDGGVYEVSAAATAMAEGIAQVVARHGGGALFMDYGYGEEPGYGETLQAVGGHEFADVLADPGENDLSAHVDFAALAEAARHGGAAVHGPRGQGRFLVDLGIMGRAERLMKANPESARSLFTGVERLIDPAKMGDLFKALVLMPSSAAKPPDSEDSVLTMGPPVHHAANLSRLPGIAHGFFGREGGVSEDVYATLNCGPGSKDDPAKVKENRSRVMKALSTEGAKLITLAQIHSPNVHIVSAGWDPARHPEGDGMATALPGLALGIQTADCAPVLFADAKAGVIGAAHAGWKGALYGVLEATIAAMEGLGARRNRIAAAIGPAIAQDHYQVGPEFRAHFLAQDPAHAEFFTADAGRFRFDLPAYAGRRLARAGIGDVAHLGLCTYPPENGFFSFRRTTHRGEPDYGRQISVIMLSE